MTDIACDLFSAFLLLFVFLDNIIFFLAVNLGQVCHSIVTKPQNKVWCLIGECA